MRRLSPEEQAEARAKFEASLMARRVEAIKNYTARFAKPEDFVAKEEERAQEEKAADRAPKR